MVRKRNCWVLPSSAPVTTPGPTAAAGSLPTAQPAPCTVAALRGPPQNRDAFLGGCHTHEHPHPPGTLVDLISEKHSFRLQRLERLGLTSSSYRGWFPRLGPVTEKIQSHFWQQHKILDSSLHSSVPQFPFSQAVLAATSHPHVTKINACKLPFLISHTSV